MRAEIRRRSSYEVDVAGTGKTFTYDANGNLISDGARTLEWDGRNQLVSVTIGSHRYEYGYDGLQRRKRILEKVDGVIISEQALIWCETDICEIRDIQTGAITTVNAFGVADVSLRYHVRDHLGSVRAVSDTNGLTLAGLDFDPYGRSSISGSSSTAQEAFAGYLRGPDSIMLSLYRAYDPDLGRWLSADPAGLSEGPNLYTYVANRPITGIDPLGDSECGKCGIEVKCRKLGRSWKYGGLSHCYALLTLQDGSKTRHEGNNRGDLVGENSPGDDIGAWSLWKQQPSSCDKVNCVKNGNGGNGRYSILLNNSSHYLDRLLKKCGFLGLVNTNRT